MKNEVLHRVKEERNILHTIKRRKANWIGDISCRNCFVKHIIDGKKIEVTGRQGRRRKKLLDDLKETSGYWRLKEDALDCTVWRTFFRRGYGPVIRQTMKWMTKIFATGPLGVRRVALVLHSNRCVQRFCSMS
jgi:hypothetical protein